MLSRRECPLASADYARTRTRTGIRQRGLGYSSAGGMCVVNGLRARRSSRREIGGGVALDAGEEQVLPECSESLLRSLVTLRLTDKATGFAIRQRSSVNKKCLP
jgi:hypothetical protein